MARRKDDPAEMQRMRDWLRVAATEIGVSEEDYAPLEASLLALTGVTAHKASRPGTPLTTFILGVAAARGGDTNLNIERLTILAEEFSPETPQN